MLNSLTLIKELLLALAGCSLIYLYALIMSLKIKDKKND